MKRVWYRVYYRTSDLGTGRHRYGIVEGQEELTRALKGAVWHHELAAVLTCDHCFRRGPFDRTWWHCPIWKGGQLEQVSAGRDRILCCSEKCWDRLTGGYRGPEWLDLHDEPDRDQLQNNARFDALSRELDVRRSKVAYRRVPMPEWRGAGFCKWCNREITEKNRRSWHAECVGIYFLHSDLPKQFSFVRDRDGRKCWDCGDDRLTLDLEVDHDIPLWSVRHLPPDERRRFYGPENLRLRCDPCHTAKTAREAKERAAIRAFDKAQRPLPL